MLTIFGNLRINSLTKLEHLKASLNSFKNESDDWLINVRGTFREEAIMFLKQELGDRVRLFSLLDDSRGWLTNSLEMLEKAKHKYVLVWNEDHLNIAPPGELNKVAGEMEKYSSDYLLYSWWMSGGARKEFDTLAKKIDFKKGEHISTLNLTKEKWLKIREAGYPYYLISMCGIFRKDFLMNLWEKDQNRWPYFFKKGVFKIFGALTKVGFRKVGHKELFNKINQKIFKGRIRKYPKETPFEMEKDPERIDILPLKFSLPNRELFACIDDNINVKGYSLVERGLYRNKSDGADIESHVNSILAEVRSVLSKVDQKQVDRLVRDILSAKKIIAAGAGRVGLAVKGFVMRLKHLGLDAYVLGDMNVPALKQEDLFLVCSGSGETQTIYELVSIAHRNQSRIALVTGNPESRMGKLASSIVELKAPSKTKPIDGLVSIQPMTTLNEQSIALFFDAVVLRLMKELGETHDTMWARHSNLE